MRVWNIWKGTKNWHRNVANEEKPEHEVVSFVGEELGSWTVENEASQYVVTFYVYRTDEDRIIIQKLKKALNPGWDHHSLVWEYSDIEAAGKAAWRVLFNLDSDHYLIKEWRERWLNS